MKSKLLLLVTAMGFITSGLLAQSARVQIIHNSADAAAKMVKV